MKKNQSPESDKSTNPYIKIFDDANRRLKEEFDDLDYLSDLEEDTQNEPASIPFPYGSNKSRPYNFT